TGYQTRGIGADYMIEIAGLGGEIVSSKLFSYPPNGRSANWNDWHRIGSVQASVSQGSLEMELRRALIGSENPEVDVLLYTKSWTGEGDTSDFIQSTQYGLLSVVQRSALNSDYVLNRSDQAVLRVSLTAIRGDVDVNSIEVEPIGTVHPSEISELRLKDETGSVVSEKLFDGFSTRFDFKSVRIHNGETKFFTIHVDAVGNSGRTFGLRIPHTRDVSAPNAGMSLRDMPTGNDLAYIGRLKPGIEIDGAFRDWDGMLRSDAIKEPSTNRNKDIDIDSYSTVKNEDGAFFYLSVVGSIMVGCSAPQPSLRFLEDYAQAFEDTDRDRVPDLYDHIGSVDYSRDFDNDGTPDQFESGDIDGDGILDYPLGPDEWLNTTIPPTFLEPYSGMKVSVFIGKVETPPVRGEDLIRIFLDSDRSVSTGYLHRGLGADHLIEIEGREGSVRDAVLLTHVGGARSWSWETQGMVDYAQDYSQIEVMVERGRIGLEDGQTYDVLFETSDWNGRSRDSSGAPLTEISHDPFVLEDVGVVFQSTDGGATWTQKGDVGVGASYRAIVSNLTGNLFVLRKNGKVFGSDDEGSSWTELSDIGNYQDLVDLALDNNDYLYAAREGGEVYQSTDGGVNWNYKGDADSSATSGFIGLACDSSDYLYLLVTNGTVYRSTDSGSSWSYRGDSGSDTDYRDITTDDSDYIYVLTSSGIVNESTDGGFSWSYQADVGSETYTAIEWGYDSYLYVLAETGEVYRSSNGGSSWTYRGDVGGYIDLTDFTAVIPEFDATLLALLIALFIPTVSFIGRKRTRSRD
ncbi:MAG: WD40/YVTN/BNR-like repeat-containing protein, partial [Thermoplasmata archaeon]